jgi:hypothetical protein
VKKLLPRVITLTGILLVLLVSSGFRAHLTALARHLASGDWEVVSNKPYIDEYVRSKYSGGSSAWEVAFAAGSGRSFSLRPEHRQNSIAEIGQSTLADEPVLRIGATPLPVAYGALLQDALGEIADGLDRPSGNAVRRLIASITFGVEQKSGYIEPWAYERANTVLAKRPQTDLLRQALSAYEEFAGSRGLEFPSFAVGTDPPFDSPNAWDNAAVLLPQQGRCRGRITSLGNDSGIVEADVVSQPRLVEIRLDRRWMSDALMDSLSNRPGRAAREFSQQGELRLVPSRFWVLMPEVVTFSLADPAGAAVVQRWASDGTCCKVVCLDSDVRLSPLTVRRQRSEAFVGIRADVDPMLYAVVSRRRMSNV